MSARRYLNTNLPTRLSALPLSVPSVLSVVQTPTRLKDPPFSPSLCQKGHGK